MGHIHVDVELSAKKRLKVRMLVDTGATHSVVPVELARRLGLRRAQRRMHVELADGSRKQMAFGAVLLRLMGRETGEIVMVGPRGVEPVLGVEALEALGLAVDPRRGKLIPTRSKAVLLISVRTLRR